jgi:hypothetical protein
MTTYSFNVSGRWLDLHAETGELKSEQFLIYADGGNIAVAVSASEPPNLIYGTEAYQGEQIAAGGDGVLSVWVRATTGGSAKIKVTTEADGAPRKWPESAARVLSRSARRVGLRDQPAARVSTVFEDTALEVGKEDNAPDARARSAHVRDLRSDELLEGILGELQTISFLLQLMADVDITKTRGS